MDKFRSVFKEHYPKLVTYAMKYLNNEEEAKDVAQETFQTYWENITKLEGEPLKFLFAVARNKCLNIIKHRKYIDGHKEFILSDHASHKLDIYSLTNSAIETFSSKEFFSIVDNCLNSMPEKSKEAFYLSRDEGMSYKEIASHQGVSIKNIEYRISSVLKILRKKLNEFVNND